MVDEKERELRVGTKRETIVSKKIASQSSGHDFASGFKLEMVVIIK